MSATAKKCFPWVPPMISALLVLAGCPNPGVQGTPATDPPLAPAGLTVGNATPTTLDVSWNASTGATSYQVYRDTSPGGSFIAKRYDGSGTSFTDTGLSSNTTYYYKVRATNAGGPSSLSAGVFLSTLAGGPDTPAGLTVGNPRTTTLDISWTASTNPHGTVTYEVYRDTDSAGLFTTLAYNSTAVSFTDSGLANGTKYYYKIRAADSTGTSGFSSIVSGITQVADINPGTSGSNPKNFMVYNGALYFTATDASGTYLRKFDGTSVTTASTAATAPNYLTLYNPGTGTLLYMVANSGGNKLFSFEGTTLTAVATSPALGNPQFITVMGSTLYMSANDGINGQELMSYDGNNAVLVKDIKNPGSSSPSQLVAMGTELYFSADTGTRQLWKSDGTVSGTSMVADLSPGGLLNGSPITVFNGALYFAATTDGSNYYLYTSDGVSTETVVDGTTKVQNSSGMVVYNGALYLAALASGTDYELYKLVGSTLSPVTTFSPVTGSALSPNVSFGVFNSALYFGAAADGSSYQLYKYDGTSVTLVQTINPSGNANPGPFVVYNNRLYFQANDGNTGAELWVQY